MTDGPSSSQHQSGDVLVVIPAFNEEASLPSTLRELRQHDPQLDVLVVDDGSTDRTEHVARAAGVMVAALPFNLGVGGALRTGFRFAAREGYGCVVQLDADGQHDPSDLARLLSAIREGADVAVGSRFARDPNQYEVNVVRRGAMGFLRVLLRGLSGHAFTDTSSGYRAFGEGAIRFFAREYPVEYLSDTVEALLLAVRAGFSVVEVPVTMRAREEGRPSTRHIKLVYHYIRLLIVLAATAQSGRRRRLHSGRGDVPSGSVPGAGRTTGTDTLPAPARDLPDDLDR